MLLIDQVDLLRENLGYIRNDRTCLPLMGGRGAIRDTYRFIHLIHPARDISTTIHNADPGGDKLPAHLRGWNIKGTDGHGKEGKMYLKDFLGMLVHVYYLRIDGNVLDVSNDSGDHLIVQYDDFLNFLNRLVLSPEESVLVISHWAKIQNERQKKCIRDSIQRNRRLMQFPEAYVPGLGDFKSFLSQIKEWPDLLEAIWKRFFRSQAVQIDPHTNMANNRPDSYRSADSKGNLRWHFKWRRDGVIANVQVDIVEVIDAVVDHMQRVISCRRSRSFAI